MSILSLGTAGLLEAHDVPNSGSLQFTSAFCRSSELYHTVQRYRYNVAPALKVREKLRGQQRKHKRKELWCCDEKPVLRKHWQKSRQKSAH